jgi:AraC-like DNA-binding protein
MSAYLAGLINILDSDTGTSSIEPHKITQAKQLIVSHLGDPELGAAKLAEWIECAPNYLSFLFHKWTGRKLIDTINSYRLAHAQYLLRNSARNVKEIAALVGFADRAYFGRLFLRATGQTPLAYRRNASSAYPLSPGFTEKPGSRA